VTEAIEAIVIRDAEGRLVTWGRTNIRELASRAGLATETNESFLESLIAERPDLLGIANRSDGSDIDGPFVAFSQVALLAFNNRIIKPDLVLLWQSGHVVIVEVKLFDNPELRDRKVVAQLLEYAACFSKCNESELLECFGSGRSETSWAALIASIFPTSSDPVRLAHRLAAKFEAADLHLVIACDRAPVGLHELVSGVIRQSALGLYAFRVVEVMAFSSGINDMGVAFLPRSLLKTQVVARTAVTVNVAGGSVPAISVSVTALEDQEVATKEARADSPKGVWSEQSFFEDAQERLSEAPVAAIRMFCARAKQLGWPIRWGAGKGGSFSIILPHLADRQVLYFDSQGRLAVYFATLGGAAAELKSYLLTLPGVSFSDGSSPAYIKPAAWVPNASAILTKLENLAPSSDTVSTGGILT